MSFYSSMVLRPSFFVSLLAYSALLVLLSLTSCWYAMVMHIEHHVNLKSEYVLSQFQSEIEHSAGLIHRINSSSTNFAKLLSSTLQDTNISFSDIKTKLAPLLFKAFETVPHLAQISYIEKEGLFFSYYIDHDQVLAMYSNSSLSTSFGGASNLSVYYIQPVNRDTGELYGEAIISEVPSNIISTSWFVKAVNRSLSYASMGTKWNNGHDLLFISSARIKGTQVISLGFPVTTITDFFTRVGANLSLVTKDGKVLVEGIQNTRLGFSNDMVSFQSVNANGGQTSYDGAVSCKDGDAEAASILNIQGVEYLIRCSTIDIMEIKSVYVLAVPRKGLDHFVLDFKKKGLALLTTMIVMILIAMVSFLYINVRSLRREMHLCWSLIKQNEATQQAERKCMNKSLAFASASHDVRASLAGLTGLIEMSFHEVLPGSELGTNLRLMDSCTKDLLGLLNSILDASKVEAGKMLLEEEEFDLFQLLEDVVDLYHSVAMKKGVDIVLDPCNGSVLRYSRTKGDRGKLKQVLCNLLSNAVKFTEEGHIAVRVWAQKPSLQSSMIATHQYGSSRLLSRLCCRQNEARDDVEDFNSIQQDPNCMDFTIEVDDTGKGIPKEKHKSVFENYVQVKETALGQGGTGLGLGIVQSLVRLMHGDIGIIDKDIGEKGTCFRFNVLLTVHETQMNDDTRDDQVGSGNKNQSHGLTMSPKLSIWTRSPRSEASRVVFLIRNEERRGTTQRFMERLGIKVKVVKEWRQLHYTLKKIIKQKGLHPNSSSSPDSSDSPSASSCTNGVPLSAQDGTNYISSIFKRTDIEASSGFVLIVIDANAGPFSELCKVVSEFKRGLCYPCRVVWLENPLIPSVDNKILNKDVSNSNDIVLSKPLHGHRLFQVIRILPEYGGVWPCSSSETKKEMGQVSLTDEGAIQRVELQECGISRVTQQSYDRSRARKIPVQQGEIQECEESSNEKPLWGMKCLVVEDIVLLRRITKSTLDRLGASVMECENGEQVVQIVEEGLTRNSSNRPCDFILMDCQMPVMNGYEATRRIREIEKSHGVHIPIFALTANTGEEAKLSIEAGMDDHLIKPINKETLLKAIKRNILKSEQ